MSVSITSGRCNLRGTSPPRAQYLLSGKLFLLPIYAGSVNLGIVEDLFARMFEPHQKAALYRTEEVICRTIRVSDKPKVGIVPFVFARADLNRPLLIWVPQLKYDDLRIA